MLMVNGNSSRTVYIECSGTLQKGSQGGILRVVRNILKWSDAIGAKYGVTCHPVVSINKSNYYVISDGCAGIFHRPLEYFWGIRGRVLDWMRYRKLMEACITHRAFALFLKKYWTGIFSRLVIGLALLPWVLICVLASYVYCGLTRIGKKWNPTAGDVLLLPESVSWPFSEFRIKEAKDKGVLLIQLIYDLIPIENPAWCNDFNVSEFEKCLKRRIEYTDCILTISECTRVAMEEYLKRVDLAKNIPMRSFRLGCDIEIGSAGCPSNVRPELSEIFSNDVTVGLTVGTIEPRKNHALLLDAYDRIWDDGGQARLVVAGKLGWKCDEIVNRIMTNPQWQQNLFWFEYLSDAELDYCYKQSSVVILPTLAEGFGLPLVEALHRGCPVFASDIPVLKEIGDDYCTYFDPHDADALSKLIIGFDGESRAAVLKKVAYFKWITWEASCQEAFERMFQMLDMDESQ